MPNWRKRFGPGGFVAHITSRMTGSLPAPQKGAAAVLAQLPISRCVAASAQAAGIAGPVGWHTLRHSFGTLMKANGEDVKTIQELLRHAKLQGDDGCLYASRDRREADCAQSCSVSDHGNESEEGRCVKGAAFPYRTLSNPQDFARFLLSTLFVGVPDGIRTRVTAVKGRCPRPLDDGDAGGFAEGAGRQRDAHLRLPRGGGGVKTSRGGEGALQFAATP
jgi:integrase-like protein